jgi:hypothetical protein
LRFFCTKKPFAFSYVCGCSPLFCLNEPLMYAGVFSLLSPQIPSSCFC